MKPGEAKYSTRRNPNNPTFGARIAATAAYLGGSLMPWQRQVADVALELDPHNPGAWRYPVVVVTVPRQAGKSFLLRAIMVDRMMAYNNHEVLMTAQTGKDARKRWKQINMALSAVKKPQYFRVYASQGSERTEYLKRGSFISPFAPTPKSIHGDSLHLVTVDEAWAFDADSGLALETAINPTQLTIQDSQLWIVSTKGTAKSAYLNELIRKGRDAVNDPHARIAYFEWSADEALADADPYSDETLAFHPAVGHTQTLDKIRALATGDVSAWRRSILNLETATDNAVVDMAVWDSLTADPAPARPDMSHVVIAFDLARDGSGASIAAAWQAEDGDIHTTLIASAPGTSWVPARLHYLADQGARVFADPSGPTRTMAGDLGTELSITATSSRDYATACQLLLDRVKSGNISHDGAQQTRDALNAAEVRQLAGATAFDAHRSPEPIDALRATALAVWAATQPTVDPVQIF
ncbi:terminase large subunit [Schaalia sp. ZJ1691]|uniref:terminase large subunit n=1 Tax=Schaalia sp. ZJ1691 TaxID=2709404 RepID=UPI0013EC9F14|nr:terminase large subunit [Schaalia sp. ZJ1691]